MADSKKVCALLIDYNGLAVALSRRQHWDVDQVLIDVKNKAAENFLVQSATAFGHWEAPSRARLELNGFICEPVQTVVQICSAIQQAIERSLARGDSTDVYVLVDSDLDPTLLAKSVEQAHKELILWSVATPSADTRTLYSAWEVIPLTQLNAHNQWPRRVMLYAIAIGADYLNSERNDPFLLSHLYNHLQTLPAFNRTSVDMWLDLAVRQEIILPHQSSGPFGSPYAELNRSHPVVQKALRTRERILAVLDAMMAGREWVAFGTIEKALQSSKLLAGSQRMRQAWLELLVSEQVLLAKPLRSPGSDQVTTTLRPNSAHPIFATVGRRRLQSLSHLIVALDDLELRRRSEWVSAANLLRSLTRVTTHAEARTTLIRAQADGMVEFKSVPSRENPERKAALVRVNQANPQVRKILDRRDQLIQTTDALLRNRGLIDRELGITPFALEKELVHEEGMDEDDAFFWIQLLRYEHVLTDVRVSHAPRQVVRIVHLGLDDAVVFHALERHIHSAQEVQP